jgi:hypothetical protein
MISKAMKMTRQATLTPLSDNVRLDFSCGNAPSGKPEYRHDINHELGYKLYLEMIAKMTVVEYAAFTQKLLEFKYDLDNPAGFDHSGERTATIIQNIVDKFKKTSQSTFAFSRPEQVTFEVVKTELQVTFREGICRISDEDYEEIYNRFFDPAVIQEYIIRGVGVCYLLDSCQEALQAIKYPSFEYEQSRVEQLNWILELSTNSSDFKSKVLSSGVLLEIYFEKRHKNKNFQFKLDYESYPTSHNSTLDLILRSYQRCTAISKYQLIDGTLWFATQITNYYMSDSNITNVSFGDRVSFEVVNLNQASLIEYHVAISNSGEHLDTVAIDDFVYLADPSQTKSRINQLKAKLGLIMIELIEPEFPRGYTRDLSEMQVCELHWDYHFPYYGYEGRNDALSRFLQSEDYKQCIQGFVVEHSYCEL